MTLADWLKTKPERSLKINVLKKLSEILLALHMENITHRAITPQNIIIKETNAAGAVLPYLTNFELCHLEYLPTIVPENRRSIDIEFQAREVNTPGDILTTSADVYSFGKIACYTLSEDNSIPFGSYIDLNKFIRKKNAWSDYIKKMGIDESQLDNLKKMLSMDPAERPVGEQLVGILSNWH
jgi:serine/threonine-protein kinase